MIKILSTDTLIDVVNKIQNCPDKELLLEFPTGHNILKNYMSLKLIKSKAWNKRITILTHDLTSKKIGQPLWIHYSLIKDKDFYSQKNFKQELLKHNFTFWEYFVFTIKKYFSRTIQFIGRKTGISPLKYYNPYNTLRKSWVFFLLFGLMVSIGMLFFIFYFAVSKTYIEIIPEITIKTDAINITYEENPTSSESIFNNELKIPIKKITQVVEASYTHETTGIDFENTSKAAWDVIVINELRDEQVFRPKTRLLSKDGLVYETQDWVTIPGSFRDEEGEYQPGTVTINVVGRITDTSGAYVWEKGNIAKDEMLTFPGLQFNQDRIYAKTLEDFTGGGLDIVHIVAPDDYKNAKNVLQTMLENKALDTLKKDIIEENATFGVQHEILPIDGILTYKNFEVSSSPAQIDVDKRLDSFTLTGTITLEAYTYNKTSVLNMMRNIITDGLLSGTDKLIFIDDTSVRMPIILSQSQGPLTIKATTEVDVGISYDFDNNANNYNQRLKALIVGLDNDEAKNILLNEERVKNVIIKNTPFFIKRVSSNADNIIMKIQSAQ